MKEGIFSRDLALTLSVSEQLEFVFRPLENPQMSLMEGQLEPRPTPYTPTGARLGLDFLCNSFLRKAQRVPR